MLHRLIVCLALSCCVCATARAQEDDGAAESELARVQRDQSRIGLRIGSLREKMERLAQRYEDEGRTRNATLLREALKDFDAKSVLNVSHELERNLAQSNLSSVEQQDALVAMLEEIYAVLRDRRDADELQRQADMARQAAEELSLLARNQRRLLSSTHAATDRPAGLLKEALELAARLGEALQSTRSAAQAAQNAEEALGDSALADQLAQQQRALSQEAAPTSPTQALLEQALELLRERLEQPAADSQPGQAPLGDELLSAAQASRDKAREAAAAAAEAMADAREGLERAQAEAPRGDDASVGKTSTGDKPAGAAAPSDSSAGDKAAGDGAGATPEDPADVTPEDGEAASDPESAARAAMQDATAELERTRDELERSERSLAAARNRARALAQASSEEAADKGADMTELAQRLEAVEPEAGPELLDRTRKLLEELRQLADAVDRGDLADAGAQQGAARASLDELIRQLQARAQQTPDAGERKPEAQELSALADQQQELQRQVQELMARLTDLPDQNYKEPAERASRSMGSAEKALRSGDMEEAPVREEEAAEQLEQAQKKLSGERDKYEQLRQEEVLFRLHEELKLLLDRHDAIAAETLELERGRGEGDGERLGRSQRRAVARLSGQERDLSVQAEIVRVALHKDGAVAFTFALDRCRDDLSSAADLLADEQTGYLVQSVQADIHQRLTDLLAVLDAERERRRNAKTEEPPPGEQPPGQTKPQLVPTVAELLLIQRMEQAALARLENFERLNPQLADEEGVDEVSRELLERWALEHTRVTELFRAMIPGQGGPPGAGQGEQAPPKTAPDGTSPHPGTAPEPEPAPEPELSPTPGTDPGEENP